MPVIPVFENTEAVPNAPGPPRADPSAFMAPGAALAQGADELSGTLQNWSQRYQDAKRQADAANITADGISQLQDAHFRWSRTPDSQAAVAGFQDEADKIKAAALARTDDPFTQSFVTRELALSSAQFGAQVHDKAFALESSARRGQVDQRLNTYSLAAANAPTDELRQHYVDLANADIAGTVHAGWMQPEEGVQRQLIFRSRIQEVNARQDMSSDVQTALQKLADPTSYPGLDPDRRAELERMAQRRWEAETNRGIAAQAHADAVAEREQRRTQGANAASVIAGVVNGGDVSTSDLADMVRTGQLSESGFQAVMSAQNRQREGQDNPQAAVDLYRQLGDGSLTFETINQALANRQIKGATAVELQKGLNARDTHGDSAVDHANFDTLKTALGGHAIEKQLVDLTNETGRAAAAKWTEAQGEWTRRVLVGGEPSATVLQDMLPRYATPPQVPQAWPQPRFGAVNSLGDVATIARTTQAAAATGQITPDEFKAQQDLLARWGRYYEAQSAKAAAAKPAPQQQQSGARAKVRGLVPGATE